MSPVSPKGRCRVCHQLRCADPAHKRQPRQQTPRQLERPERKSYAETQRRAAVVKAWLWEYGITLDNGDVIARCPECRQMRAHWVADHIVPYAEGGSEDGELRVHCRRCAGRQGALIAAKRRQGRGAA